jgi:hypothetical protein
LAPREHEQIALLEAFGLPRSGLVERGAFKVSPPRRLSQVSWAHECEAPGFAKRSRLRGTKALGVSYEKKLARALPRGSLHGQWFVYSADGRVGYCQPDFLLRGRSELAVLEAKLTDVEAAWEQLEGLYAPVLEACYSKKVLKIAVTRSVARVGASERVCETLAEAIMLARSAHFRPVLHWLGTGRI